MTKLKPLGNRVVIRRKEAVTTKGGILLPESAQDKKTNEGTVIAVGPGKTNEQGEVEAMSVKIDDTVLFSSYAGTPAKVAADADEELLIMSEDEILGVVE